MADDDLVFLKPSTVVEPLIAGWYAWSYLIAPAQASMHLTFKCLPLLESFISNPSVHWAASRDPTLFGGPFVHLEETDVDAARKQLEETHCKFGRAIAFANELRKFEQKLREGATGQCLDDYYDTLPDVLRGLLDLSYDVSGHPVVRLREALLYEDAITRDVQQFRLSRPATHERRFFMSTPRLRSSQEIELNFPFCDERLDHLARMRTSARAFEEIAGALSVTPSQAPMLREFFTPTVPARRCPQHAADDVRVRYFGHACVLVQSSSVSILIDPLCATEAAEDDRFTMADLPDFIDYLVLSHNHQDHCVPEILLQLRHRTGRVIVPRNNPGALADPSMKLILRHLGFRNISAIEEFDRIEVPGGDITSLPFAGEHADLDVCSRQAILVTLKGRSLLFAVDSDCRDAELYQRILRRIARPIDAVFLGMECRGAPLTWLYGALLTRTVTRRNDESRRLSGADAQRAWGLIKAAKPRCAYVYAMGQEPWLRYLMGLEYTPDSVQLRESNELIERCREASIPAERLHISREIRF